MDPSMKEKVVSYTKDVVLSFSKLNADITRIDEAYEEVNKSYINNFGGTTKDVERFKNIEQIQKKIFFTLQSIDASALEKEYADKINKIIADSNGRTQLPNAIRCKVKKLFHKNIQKD